MNKERFELQHDVRVEDLTWKLHPSKQYETAVVGDYCVYREISTDTYEVVYNNSVLHWRVNLGKILRASA